MLSKRWIKHECPSSLKDAFCGELGINPITASILINRDIREVGDADAFLKASLDSLVDPFLLGDMPKVVERVIRAIKNGEEILVYGDYDADGITSTALLHLLFRGIGKNTSYYIPERVEEGYGLNMAALKKFREMGVSLMITVDCGISSNEEVAAASAMGIDIIVTDHHEPPEQLPPAYAILNPCIKGCRYPFKGLAGVGVAFKLAQGVLAGLEGKDTSGPGISPELAAFLDLVALGTIADVVPLKGENRVLVRHGLKLIEEGRRPGVRMLKEVAMLGGRKFRSSSVGFQLAPRLNASGRLGKAALGVKLLVTEDPEEARSIAEELDSLNRERQSIEGDILDEARSIIQWDEDPESRTIVLASDRWHQGVIGIVASKLVEEFYKPTVLISMDESLGKGSARSIPSFHLYKGLDGCSGWLESFGGHKYAAGLSIRRENLEPFKRDFELHVRQTLSPEDFIPFLTIDGEVELDDVDWELHEELSRLAPHGAGNPEPVLYACGLEVHYPKVVGRNHVRMKIRQGRRMMSAIGFNMGDIYQNLAMGRGLVDAAFCLNVNEWQGDTELQLNLKDVHF